MKDLESTVTFSDLFSGRLITQQGVRELDRREAGGNENTWESSTV